MDTKDASASRKMTRRYAACLRQERERHAWTQSEVAERIGTTQINVSRWENGTTVPTPYFRQKLSELFNKNIQELGFIVENIEEVQIWNVPYRRNPFFTGREVILEHLYTVLRSSKTAALTQPQAISGLGGIGKTQVAVEYAYRYSNNYSAIFWINAATREAISADFAMIAALLSLHEKHAQDQDIVIRAVKHWLSTHDDWLLILDNVDNLEMVLDFLPTRITGDVLLTTRLHALGTVAQSIEVEKMGQEEGVTFLLRRIKVIAPDVPLDQAPPESRVQASEIFRALDGLPLALDQAGAYIEETRCGLSQYLHLYATRRKELLLRRGQSLHDHPDSVAATWSLSFQQVKQENPAVADLLYLLAFLDPEAIPEEIIHLGAVELGPILEPVAKDPLQLNTIIELLLRYSLIRRTPEAHSLSIHRLVQAVLKDDMDKDTQRLWAERTINAVNCAFPDVEPQTWDLCQRCLLHVQICATYVEEYDLTIPSAARLFNEAASYLMAHARYQQAEVLLRKALEVRQQVLEANHPDTARTLNALGEVYLSQEYHSDEVESMLQQALAIRQQLLGAEHPDVAQTLYNMANLYRAQGAYIKAEPLYLQALRIRETVFGINHLLVAQSYYGLAKLYNSQKKYQEAEKLCKQALYIQELHLGTMHPLVASTLSMLAKIYQGQHKLEKARESNLQALHIRESASSEAYPQVATIINSLVEIYHAEGKYREAEPLIARALRIHEQTLGSQHPFIAYSLSNLAENFFLQGDYEQAELYYKKALAIREQHLEATHPHTASTYYLLARLYFILRQYEVAEVFSRKALSVRESVFGSNHPDVVNSLEQYTALLKKLNRENEACSYEERIQSIQAEHKVSEGR